MELDRYERVGTKRRVRRAGEVGREAASVSAVGIGSDGSWEPSVTGSPGGARLRGDVRAGLGVVLVLVAELGDKSQLVALGFGARYRLRPTKVARSAVSCRDR